MEMHGEYQISADRRTVWDALNEPTVLKACLEGCESFDKKSSKYIRNRTALIILLTALIILLTSFLYLIIIMQRLLNIILILIL